MTRHTWIYQGVRKYALADHLGFRLCSAVEFIHFGNKEG